MNIFASSLDFSLLYELLYTVPNILGYQPHISRKIGFQNKNSKNNGGDDSGNLLSTTGFQLTYFPITFKAQINLNLI